MFIVSIGPIQVPVPMQLTTVIANKIKHKHIQKESRFPLPFTANVMHPLSVLLFEPPFTTQAEAWQAIPQVSKWVVGIIKRGCSLHIA